MTRIHEVSGDDMDGSIHDFIVRPVIRYEVYEYTRDAKDGRRDRVLGVVESADHANRLAQALADAARAPGASVTIQPCANLSIRGESKGGTDAPWRVIDMDEVRARAGTLR